MNHRRRVPWWHVWRWGDTGLCVCGLPWPCLDAGFHSYSAPPRESGGRRNRVREEHEWKRL
ncbi:hypothetical protein GCM10010123_31070 [Pilimelia anulata]|uniref:Uncharacterized protein n=1 Tax=Pilimelia anulata TaxID=53371 RepID=A0A8J3FC61_9ACTN|nr:hypothetical protein GCM10010123_31070 [Pilimelia anulata]